MALQLAKATEADIPILYDVQMTAFLNSDPVNQLIYKANGITPSARAAGIKRLQNELNKPGTVYMKVTDPALVPSAKGPNEPTSSVPGGIIAYSRWTINPHPTPRSEWTKPYVPHDAGEGINADLMRAFFTGIVNHRKDIVKGKPHVGLNLLATLPAHERRGAGTLQMKWGIDRALRDGLDCYLEATPAGMPLYQRMGFELVSEWELDTAPFGGDFCWKTWYLWKPASEESRQRGAFAPDEDEDR